MGRVARAAGAPFHLVVDVDGVWAGSTLSGCVINGYNSGANAGAGADQTSWYVGGTLSTPLKGLKVGAAYDYAGVSTQPLSGSSYANAVALYASYQVTERLTVHRAASTASSDDLTWPERRCWERAGLSPSRAPCNTTSGRTC